MEETWPWLRRRYDCRLFRKWMKIVIGCEATSHDFHTLKLRKEHCSSFSFSKVTIRALTGPRLYSNGQAPAKGARWAAGKPFALSQSRFRSVHSTHSHSEPPKLTAHKTSPILLELLIPRLCLVYLPLSQLRAFCPNPRPPPLAVSSSKMARPVPTPNGTAFGSELLSATLLPSSFSCPSYSSSPSSIYGARAPTSARHALGSRLTGQFSSKSMPLSAFGRTAQKWSARTHSILWSCSSRRVS